MLTQTPAHLYTGSGALQLQSLTENEGFLSLSSLLILEPLLNVFIIFFFVLQCKLFFSFCEEKQIQICDFISQYFFLLSNQLLIAFFILY